MSKMQYKIYGAENCIRCERAKNKLLADGNEITEEHDAEAHSKGDLSGWRDRPIDFAEFKAQLCMFSDELPVIYNITTGKFLSKERTNQLCKR